jgi:hypothetical protein
VRGWKTSVTTSPPNDYYISQTGRLLRRFDGKATQFSDSLAPHWSAQGTSGIIRATRQEFERLIPEIPYIGGKANSLTQDLIDCTMLLAFHRILKGEGLRTEETGKLVIEMEERRVRSYPRFLRKLLGMIIHSPLGKSRLRETAARSQERQYRGDWVSVYIDGDGADFDFGVDYLECGLCKFFRQQDADEFTPYLCQFDYVQQRAMQTGFVRTTTLAEGAERCDFRWTRGGETSPGWPPSWLEETDVPAGRVRGQTARS